MRADISRITSVLGKAQPFHIDRPPARHFGRAGTTVLTQPFKQLTGSSSLSRPFGLAFGGLMPGYILAIREIFPGALVMAAGSWLAGRRDPCFNVVNLLLIGVLVPGMPRRGERILDPRWVEERCSMLLREQPRC